MVLRAAAAWAVAAWWGLAAGAAAGHELGPFQVYGTFERGGAFRLDVRVDQEHLQTAQMGGPAHPTRYGRIAGLSGPEEATFGRYLSDLADSLTLSFDGAKVGAHLAIDPEPAIPGSDGGGPMRATMRVEGWIPGGARAFTLSSSLPVKSFPLVLRCEGDDSSTWRWVAGGATSPPYVLAAGVAPPASAGVARRSFAAGFARVLPHGPLALLAVAALFLVARRAGAALWMLAVLVLGQGLGVVLALRGSLPPLPDLQRLIGPLPALAVAALAAAGLVTRGAGQAGRVAGHGAEREAEAGAGVGAGPLGSGASWSLPWPAGWRRRHLAVAGLLAVLTAALGTLLGLDLATLMSGAAPIPPLLPATAGGLALGAAAAELAVLAAAFLLVGLPYRDRPWYRARVVVPACCLIALVGLYWSLGGAVP